MPLVNCGHTSRLTMSTISSSAKCKADSNLQQNEYKSNIMKPTTNLLRTRSLRLPSKTRDHQLYSMSGSLIKEKDVNTSNNSGNNWCGSLPGNANTKTNTKIASNESNIPSNNITMRSTRKAKSPVVAIKDAFIPRFIASRKSSDKLGPNYSINNDLSNDSIYYSKKDSYEKRLSNSLSSSYNEKYLNSDYIKYERPSLIECPASPVSNSSIDSGINSMAQNYLTHLRKLTEEHERLQIDYSRLRQQYIELSSIVPNSSNNDSLSDETLVVESVESELKKQTKLAKNYKDESFRLQEELRKFQRKYWDNMVNRQTSNGSDAVFTESSEILGTEKDLQSCTHLMEKITNLEQKIKELENENKEVKENIEFLTSERSILAEALKEAEENLFKERLEWTKDKDVLEELKLKSKKIFEKLKEKSENIKQLESNISTKESELQKFKVQNNDYQKLCNELNTFLSEFRNSLLSVLSTYHQNKDSVEIQSQLPVIDVTKYTPEIHDELKLFCDFTNDIFNDYFRENDELKSEVSNYIEENVNLKKEAKHHEALIEEQNMRINHLRREIHENQEKMVDLNNEIDVLSEKFRCTESVNKELKSLFDETNNPSILSSQNVLSLRQEVATLKESLSVKEDMLQRLGAKYSRNRKIWEDNDKKATQEIKKLDDIVDQVIETLKSLPETVRNNESLRDLLVLLTNESTYEEKQK